MRTTRPIRLGSFPLTLFLKKSLQFCQSNWWVFVLFGVGLVVVALNRGGNLAEISTIFVLHCVADLFIMTMISEYAQGNFRSGTLAQIVAKFIFVSLTLYEGLAYGSWHYLSAEFLYLLAAIKNYRKDVLGKPTPAINMQSLSVIGVLLYGAMILQGSLFAGVAQMIQTAGIFIFGIGLSVSNNERLRYRLGLLGCVGMVTGSGWECFRTFQLGAMEGLAFSYFLLPLTVLAFYLRLWNRFKA